ncbi:hypothetical protein V502_10988 [Pseudogymnoascus sp. VKM F-4520 (FW-2644)]|nr:hypothetical protein V502_10988 [Pseudogymnoascus sp. VKM F-4520 (FW-2644)]
MKSLFLHPRPSAILPPNRYTSADLDPVPFIHRTWAWYNIGGFWISEGFQVPILQMAGGLVAAGLSPGLAMGAIVLGNFLAMIPCASSGYIGAKFGINYPVMNRASWGVEGAKLAVALRGIVAVCWFGVQIATGGACVNTMLTAIWPSLPSRVPNHLPAGAHTTSLDLLCFFLFWFITLPFLYIHVSKLRWLFFVKMLLMPILGLGLFIWSIVHAHGFGPVFSQPTVIHSPGQSIVFVFFTAITSTIGPQATFALNMGDFCRYAKSPRGAFISQFIMMPICLTLTAFLGVTMASASMVIFRLDEPQWNPLVVIGMFESRAAQFFIGLLFALATLCTNIAGNSVAFGNDLSSLFPRFINIRRGQFICAILGVIITPWNILNTSGNFLNFLNGYTVFLGPVCGIMMTDFWILRRRQLNLQQLYQPDGHYSFTKGWNFRAIAAFLLSLTPTLPGLAASVASSNKVPKGFGDIYTSNWAVGLVLAGGFYCGFSIMWPVSIWNEGDSDIAKVYLETLGVDSVSQEIKEKDVVVDELSVGES